MDSSWRESDTETWGEKLFPHDEAYPDQLRLIRYRAQLVAGMGVVLTCGTFLIDLIQKPNSEGLALLWGARIFTLIVLVIAFLLFRSEALTLPRMLALTYTNYFLVSAGFAVMVFAGRQGTLFMAFQAVAVSALLLPLTTAQATLLQGIILAVVMGLAPPAIALGEMESRFYFAALYMFAGTLVIVRTVAEMTHKVRVSEAQSRLRIEEAYNRLNFLSSYDHLTKVMNRANFEAAAEQAVVEARGSSQPLSYLEVDLDHFKQINDTMGHQAGDAVLRAASERIASCLRTGDQVGRMGGDEFGVLIRGAPADVASNVAQRILESFTSSQLRTSWGDLPLSCTIGVAWYPGWGQLTTASLMAAADESLYEAKEAGRGRVGSVRTPPSPEANLSGEYPVPGTATFSSELPANFRQPVHSRPDGHQTGDGDSASSTGSPTPPAEGGESPADTPVANPPHRR